MAAKKTPPAPKRIKEQQIASNNKLEYAGFLIRLVASIIDGLVIGAFMFLFGLFMSIMLGEEAARTLTFPFNTIASYAYYVYFTGKSGQTPGKKTMKIKVVKTDTLEHPEYGGAFMREVVGKFISSIVLGLGYLWVIWDKQKQGWHDKLANTYVIKLEK